VSTLRVAFAGTPEFAQIALARLHAAGFETVLVLTQPDRPAGRGMKLHASPVKAFALEHALPIAQPRSLRLDGKYPDEAALGRDALIAARPDVLVVAAYGLILPQWVLDTPRLGCLNIHASLLPRWRGAAPIQRAIMAGDAETGMMVMKMEKGLDTGPVALTRKIAIGATMTAGELHDHLMLAGAKAMAEAMAKLEMGDLPLTQQAEVGVLYASKIDKGETRIDFSKPATEVDSHIRGLSPFPGAWFGADLNGKPERIKVLASELGQGQGEPGTVIGADLTIACGDGAVRLLRLQKAGGKPMATTEFLRGTALVAGTRLG